MGFYDIVFANCYEIRMKQVYRSQQVINRFFYQASDAYGGALSGITGAFFSGWNTNAAPCQSQECDYDKVSVQELFGDRQSYEDNVTGANGSQAGGELPAFFGARFTYVPSNTRVRKGRKILSGILEEMVDLDAIAAGYAASFAALAAFFEGTLSVGGIDFVPVLLSPANTLHAADVITAVVGVVWTSWSTQNSRKIGRGS